MHPKIFKSNRGQVIIEYVLLLSLAAIIAVTLINALGKRSEEFDESGALIKAWNKMLMVIGEDEPVSGTGKK